MKPLSEVTRTAFTRATPANYRTVFEARFGLLGVIILVFLMVGGIVLLLGPSPWE